MKKLKIVSLIICGTLMLTSCDEDDSVSQGTIQVEASSILGGWSVELYRDGSENETSSFNDIRFEFVTENEFLIFRGNEELLIGTWILRDQGRELDISVPALAGDNEAFGEELYEISDDWDITFSSETELHLVDEDERFELLRTPQEAARISFKPVSLCRQAFFMFVGYRLSDQ